MSSEIAIKVSNLSKCYQIYNQPNKQPRGKPRGIG